MKMMINRLILVLAPLLIVVQASRRTPEQIFLSLTAIPNAYAIHFVTFQSDIDNCGAASVTLFMSSQVTRRDVPASTVRGYTFGKVLSSSEPWRTHHVALLDNLIPNESYQYVVQTQNCGKSSPYNFTFKSHHRRFCVFADLDVNHALSPLNSPIPVLSKSNCDFIAAVGDIGYNLYYNHGGVADTFFNAMSALSTNIPFLFIVGDHEWNKTPSVNTSFGYSIYEEYIGPITSRYMNNNNSTRNFFTLPIIKSDISFRAVVLNTDKYLTRRNTSERTYPSNDVAGRYTTWLSNVIMNNNDRAGIDIVFGHRSIYCHKSSDSECNITSSEPSEIHELQSKIEDLIFGNTMIVFSGHTHHYERSWPVRSHGSDVTTFASISDYYWKRDSPTYVVTGSAGQNCDDFNVDAPSFNAFRHTKCEMSVTIVDCDPKKFLMHIKQVSTNASNNSVIDSFKIHYNRNYLRKKEDGDTSQSSSLLLQVLILLNGAVVTMMYYYKRKQR